MSCRLCVVYNPKGGGGRASDVLQNSLPYFERHQFHLEIYETHYPHHGADLVRDFDLDRFEGILVVGGDGSIHDIVNGLMSRKDNRRIPIGILPAGTGNSFMEDVGCLDPIEAARRIVRLEPRFVDIVEVKTRGEVRYAFNVIGWGIPADINRRAETMRWLGKQRYTAAALIEILFMKSPHAILRIEGEISEGKVVFAMGCLGRFTGAGMKMAPRAVLDDGLVDLLVVRNPGKLELLGVFPKIFTGDHLSHPKLEYRQVTEFSISSSEPGVLNLDGEVFPDRDMEVRVLPHAIQVLV